MILFKRGVIVVRQTYNWSKVQTVDELKPEKFDKLVGHPIGTTRYSVELWNKIFKKSFFGAFSDKV